MGQGEHVPGAVRRAHNERDGDGVGRGWLLRWPGSHHDAASQPGDARPVAAEMPPGSALLFLGSILHGAGANQSDHVRRAVITSYCLGWLRTFENQYLVYPPAIARAFDPDLAARLHATWNSPKRRCR